MKNKDKLKQSLTVLFQRGAEKLTNVEMGYVEPSKNTPDFAQCSSCALFTGGKRNRCFVHGPEIEILPGDSCMLYLQGKPMEKYAGKEETLTTPTESGFVRRSTRCENCYSFNVKASRCYLFDALNKELPEQFDLDPKVIPQGCCNFQRAKPNESK